MQKDYSSYTEEDFIADESFRQWVNAPDAEQTAYWEGVLARWPEKGEAMKAARFFIENLQFRTDHPTPQQTDASLQRSLQKIALAGQHEPIVPLRARRRKRVLYGILAMACAVVAVTFMPVLRPSARLTIETVAGPLQIRTLVLPDSSEVTLNAGAHLTYSAGMKQERHREVWLEGEAFFHVRHMDHAGTPGRFTVHTGDLDIEVLGTSFNVKKAGAFTNVSLNSGQIRIGFKDDPQSAIYLKPGDFMQYSSREKHIVKKQVKPELYSVWKEEKMKMDHMPLSEIARLLEDAYGYRVRIADGDLAGTELSGTLVMKDESTILETLAASLDIEVIKKDRELTFQLKPKY